MRYEIGKKFICEDIGQSVKPKPIDYFIPTEKDNYKYLNLFGKIISGQFEREYLKRQKQKDEIHTFFNNRESRR